jgi:phospholipid/cholesterol/gamma-HCH transport system substrate-binding protein
VERDRSLEIKVGLFVALALAGFIGLVIVLGSEDALFEKRYPLNTEFGDGGGLRSGAAVFVAGLDCGLVSSVDFSTDLGEKKVIVGLSVREACRERIRKDSLATISSQGLLGDKTVSISIGSKDAEVQNDEGWLKSKDPAELSYIIDNGREIVEGAKRIVTKIDYALGTEDAEGAGKSVLAILQSIRTILADVEGGNGLIHALVYDEAATRRLKSALASVDAATDDFAALTKAVKEGDGAIHNLIYEDKITGEVQALVKNLNNTSLRIDALVVEIQTGDGLIHDLVYTDKGQSMLADLKDVSTDIKDVVALVKRGEGTLGGLIVDPTIYQDVKTLLGKAQRNKILKAYVRDTLRQNEQEEGVSPAGLSE